MRIAAPPGIKKLETLYHSGSGGSSSSSSHSSEMIIVGETFSNRWCQCSCAHHLPTTSSAAAAAGSLDASPASSSSSSSNSDASVSRIPSLMSLRTPFNNSCLFLAPPPPPSSSSSSKRSHEAAARIRAPSPPRRSFGDRGNRSDEHHGGSRHMDVGPQRRRLQDHRVRDDGRRVSSFEDRKRPERGFQDSGRVSLSLKHL